MITRNFFSHFISSNQSPRTNMELTGETDRGKYIGHSLVIPICKLAVRTSHVLKTNILVSRYTTSATMG